MNQDLPTLLVKISMTLEDQNVNEMVFLCVDLLTATERQSIKDGATLFPALQKKGLVSQDDLSFLKEILCKVGRIDILKEHWLMSESEIKKLQSSEGHISPYRSLLYFISQNLGSDDVKNVKFHVYNQKAKLKHTGSMLDVLTEMEKDLYVTKNNLRKLYETLRVIGRNDLCEKIQSFENQDRQAAYIDSKQEETSTQVNPTNQPENLSSASEKSKTLEHYKLDKNPHGWCVILNNEDFTKAGLNEQNKPNLENRHGTNKDAETISKVFKRRNYIVEEHKNSTGEEILDIMRKYQKNDHSDKDSFICFILSHGYQGVVVGVDGKEANIKDLKSCFNGTNCPSLVGKPKVFFIQACQGDEVDHGVPYDEECARKPTYQMDGGNIPITADFLTAFSSTEDYLSLRGQEGSLFIQKLCELLEDSNFFHQDLKNILTKVQHDIASGNYKLQNKLVAKQMPTFITNLRKHLILPPPGNFQSLI